MPFPYALAIFDLDGTLVDSAEDIAEAVNRMREELGGPRVPVATVLGWIGDGVGHLVETALADGGIEVPLAAAMPVFMRHYRDCLLRSPRLFPGVREALDALHAQGVPMAICTNKPEAMVAPLLDHFGIEGLFALVIGGDTLPVHKPSGEPLRHIAAHFGVGIDAALMVGDSITDYAAARAAGMPVALVRYGYPRGLDFAQAAAVAVVDDLRNLPGLAPAWA